MSQITITLDDKLLQDAQAYVRQHGQELDDLVARLLAVTVQPAVPEPAAPVLTTEQRLAIVHRLAGSLKAPADFDYKKELEEGLREKYGL
ncbi:MAG: hypothetical protein EOO57_08360 [Hymenobacter sp.]|nr:MAG: hypothetical protein EOO57_08360 [Hymenobacter sp.]